jgi:hypothetical protein
MKKPKVSAKKILPAAALPLLALLAATASINAEKPLLEDLEMRVTSIEQRRNFLNPSARPGVQDGHDIFFTASALYWKPNEDGLEYALDNTKGTSSRFADKGRIKHTRGKWSWGWEAGIGYNMAHDKWDLYLNWTHLNGLSHHENSDEDEECCTRCCPQICSGKLFPIWINWQTPEVPVCLYTCEVKSHFQMRLDLLDLELGRDFFVSKSLCMRPFAGLRWTLIKNKHAVDYSGYFSSSPQIPPPDDDPPLIADLSADADIDLHSHFWGIGPRAGLNSLWNFAPRWAIFGNTALSLLYGTMRSKYEMTLKNPSRMNRGEVKDHQHLTRAVIDLALGLEWDYQFKNDLMHLGFSLGWEHHLFYGMNRFIRFLDNQEQGSLTAYQGDIATQGFTLTGRLDF